MPNQRSPNRLCPISRRGDRLWLIVLAASFVFAVAVSWNRWGNPLIDTGREMNQPLRLASGEMLYSDVRHIYGPVSPWLHAVLFDAFGPSLTVLYVDGTITAVAMLGLLYWLGRQIMGPAGTGAATLSIMWLCVFKPAGNYILPYSFNALHAALFGLITLAILAAALKQRGDATAAFLLAGTAAGIAILTKTEIGLAALAACTAAALLAPHSDWRRRVRLAVCIAVPAVSLPLVVYALIAARVGWSTLVGDSWLLLYNMPPELAFFNSRVSGFDDPLDSVRRMTIAAVKLGIVAAVVAAIALTGDVGRAHARDRRTAIRPPHLVAAAVLLAIAMSITTGLDPDKGPYLAMPILLVGLLGTLIRRVGNAGDRPVSARTLILITYTVYALASLARMILHVRSGGAYASVLLPVSVVIFTYLWLGPFAACFRQGRARRLARRLALALLVVNAVATAGILAYRYQSRQTVTIATPRGTMIADRDIGQAWNEALSYIERHTRPGDTVAVLPEGTSLNFLSGRRNPLRDEISIPGVLDAEAERLAIVRLQDARTPLVLITNRPTAEFGPVAFGRDYGRQLMRWIEAHYTRCAMFGPVKDRTLEIGNAPFFIHAYCAAASSTSAPTVPHTSSGGRT